MDENKPDSVDFVATDPPYNIQLPITMAGGKLAAVGSVRLGFPVVDVPTG